MQFDDLESGRQCPPRGGEKRIRDARDPREVELDRRGMKG